MPLGGIGTGTVSLTGRGALSDFEVMNRPAKGYTPDSCFFALRTRTASGTTARLLEGPLPDHLVHGATGSTAPQHGLPRFRSASFSAAYPFATVDLRDPAVPLRVRLEAFNPLTPPDVDASSYPAAVVRFVLTNPASTPVKASVVASLRNFIGADGSVTKPRWGGYPDHAWLYKRNRNTLRRTSRVRGLSLASEGLEPDAETFGTLALATTARAGVSHRTSWADRSWGDSLLDFWDDFTHDGKLDDRDPGAQQGPVASLCVSLDVPARAERQVTFLLGWHFPNRVSWTDKAARVGNYYTTRHPDAFAAVDELASRLPDLECRTTAFVSGFLSSSLPDVVKEAALFNLSTLRSQTCFRTEDGHFYGWEGCHPHEGSCHGSCTHVWNYEAALPALFGPIARDQRVLEFEHATDDRGLMSFRINLPLERARQQAHAAADGQMGCVVRLYREYRACGDSDFLRRLYPGMKRALAFAWIPGGWDADRDGVMEGCQHNTMDVEYYGPNPQMQGLYLAALLAGAALAEAVGDAPFAAECSRLFASGSAASDARLFNGEYYEQLVLPPGKNPVADGLRIGMGATDPNDPDFQLGAGCLVDQLVGQYLAHQAGLGHVLDPDHVRSTYRAVHRHNFRPSLHDHFNHLRTFALAGESATLMATYPRGRRPRRPFPYYNEVMTGFEYCAAVGMLQEGLLKQGLELIAAIRSRYDGTRRNPFDEAECGHHYARAMASFAAVSALQGSDYDGLTRTLTLAPRVRRPQNQFFIATGDAWGTARLSRSAFSLTLGAGTLPLRRVKLPGHDLTLDRTLRAGDTWSARLRKASTPRA